MGGGGLQLQLKFQWTETVPAPHDSLEPGEAPFPREVICLRCSSWEPACRLSQGLNVFWHLCRSWSSPRRLRGEDEPGPGGLPVLVIARPICAYPAQPCACRDLSPGLQAFLHRSLMISVLAIFMVLIYLAASSTEKKQEKLPSQARFFWNPCLFPPQQAEPWLIKSLCVGSDMGVWESSPVSQSLLGRIRVPSTPPASAACQEGCQARGDSCEDVSHPTGIPV